MKKLWICLLAVMMFALTGCAELELFRDMEWDSEIEFSDDVLILEPGETESFYIDNYDYIKNLKYKLVYNDIADITPLEDGEFSVTAKALGETSISFYASYCTHADFRIMVSNDTDEAWEQFYEEEEEEEDDWEDWDDEDWVDEEDYEYDASNYESDDWQEMFTDDSEPVNTRAYAMTVHVEADDLASFLDLDDLELEPADITMTNAAFAINKDGTYTMTVDFDEVRNSFIAFINARMENLILGQCISEGYSSLEERAEDEGYDSVDELRTELTEQITETMNDQWPEDVKGTVTYSGYVEKLSESIYLYDKEGETLFDSCEMAEDESISIEVYADDEFNPIAIDCMWYWR